MHLALVVASLRGMDEHIFIRHLLGARLCCRHCHVLSLGPHSDPAVLRASALSDKEAEKSGDVPKLPRLESACVFPSPPSVQPPGLEVPAAEARLWTRGLTKVPQKESQVFGRPQPLQPTLLFPVAEEVKQSEGEEAEEAGGTSSHGCRLCQSGCCQQGDSPPSQAPCS